MTMTLTCLNCKGAGFTDPIGDSRVDDFQTCKWCYGTGNAPEGAPDPYCVPCEGDRSIHGMPCTACNASGYDQAALSAHVKIVEETMMKGISQG